MHKLSYYLLKNAYFELINDYLKEWDRFVPMSLSIEGHPNSFAVDLNYSRDYSKMRGTDNTEAIFMEVVSIDPIVNSSQYFALRKLHDRYRAESQTPITETLTLKIIDNRICYNVISSIKVDWITLSYEQSIEIDSAGYPVLFSDQCIYRIKVRFILSKKSAFKLVKE